MRTQIGEENVYDLVKDHGPQKGLKENQQQRNLRIIGKYLSLALSNHLLYIYHLSACGGDGTVGWVLSALDMSQMQYMDFVSVGVIPLGTGNDMARFLGWGVGYRGEPLAPVIQSLAISEARLLDRWSIDVQPTAQSGAASLKVRPTNRTILFLSISPRFHNQFLIII